VYFYLSTALSPRLGFTAGLSTLMKVYEMKKQNETKQTETNENKTKPKTKNKESDRSIQSEREEHVMCVV
jgi:hypothetical protein